MNKNIIMLMSDEHVWTLSPCLECADVFICVCVNESMLMSGLLLSSLLGVLFVAVVRHPSLALQTRPSLTVSSSPQRPDGCEAAGWRECNELSFF